MDRSPTLVLECFDAYKAEASRLTSDTRACW
jgi:hypothetical protein